MRAALGLVLALLCCCTPAAAHSGHAIPVVAVGLEGYSPARLTVTEGDLVQWSLSEADGGHSVTADAGSGESFDSGVLGDGGDFTYFFARAGTYRYHSSADPAVRGTVVVLPAPEVDGTAPKLSAVRLVAQTRRRLRLSLRASEAAAVTVAVRRRGSRRVLRSTFAFVSRGRARVRVRTAGLASGRYVVAVRAEDETGNRSRVVRRRFVR